MVLKILPQNYTWEIQVQVSHATNIYVSFDACGSFKWETNFYFFLI